MIYQLGMGLALLLAGPVLFARRAAHYRPTLAGRLGLAGPEGDDPEAGAGRRGGLWLHGVSVGEAGVAAALALAVPERIPVVVTTITPTGQARARAGLGARGAVAYLPFDLGFAIRRFFDRFAPRALVLVEGDFWPLLLAEARRRGLPILVANGRVGDKGFRRMARLRPFARRLLALVDRFGVQSEIDRDRLIDLGVEPSRISVTGNLKYDTPEPILPPALAAEIERLAAGRGLLVAGSTMPGEEEAVLDAFSGLENRALLVLAPRHPERWGEVAALLAERKVDHVRRSTFLASSGTPQATVAVVLLDSLGELAGLYRLAAGAFVGGTLVPTGGHNPLEPARFGVPVAVGPSMHNFSEMADRFDRAGAWRRVADSGALARAWRGWLDDPDEARDLGLRGERLVLENRGAIARTLDLLRPALEPLAS